MVDRPAALLFDFGGVLVDAPRQSPAPATLVAQVAKLVGPAVPEEVIIQCLIDGDRTYAAWRHEVGREQQPAELSHIEVWDRFVTRDWPEPARMAVRQQATPLSYAWAWRPQWTVRPGIPEVLEAAADAGLPMAVVSNTLCGAAHRDFLTRAGLAGRFAAQLYSDEVGIRKPNPELARRAARELATPIEHCWFIGDSRLRDIDCARRAGVGTAVLMRSPRTDRDPPAPDLVPDATVRDGHELLALLTPFLNGPREG